MIKVYNMDVMKALKQMPDESVDMQITSPPYWGLRDYQVDGQVGLEKTPQEYVNQMIVIFNEVKRVLKKDGTLWLNLGDSYATQGGPQKSQTVANNSSYKWENGEAQESRKNLDYGVKIKDLVGIPWRIAFALQADGWYLRSDIIWHKPNPMPESVTDRPTKAHEYIFLMSKNAKYYYDADAIREDSIDQVATFDRYKSGKFQKVKGSLSPELNADYRNMNEGRNKRTVWTVTTQPYSEAHFATFPERLIEPCVLAGCPKDGVIYDPFMGAGTTAKVALRADRNFIGSELNQEYCEIANKRIDKLLNQTKLFT